MVPIIVKRVDVPIAGWPATANRLRNAHLSDLHLRTWDRLTKAAQQLLMGLEYDLLAVTGDFGDSPARWRRPAELAERFFAPICPPQGSFAVLGNHDSPSLAEQSGVNLTFLGNRSTTIRHDGVILTLAGVDQAADRKGDVAAALDGHGCQGPTILLAHYPSTVFGLPPGRVGLMLAGHTHGGQIRVPLLGCIWTHDRLPTRMARGLHTVGQTHLHVSAGIGASRPLPVRMLCPPEISILTLRAAPLPPSGARRGRAPRAVNTAVPENSAVPV